MIARTPAAALLSAAVLLPAAPALAQEEAPEDVIIVSIKAPDRSPQAHAGSVTVLNAADLEGRQVQTLASLSHATPNVSLDDIGTFRGVANFAIRGLGINSSIPSIDPAVGLFVDGVYIGVNAGTLFDAPDLARVYVLKGPQGVGFGRNTTGGAVMVKTVDPNFDRWEGSIRLAGEGPVDGGRGAMLGTGRLVFGGPLSERVAVRLVAQHTSDGGYFVNQVTGNHIGGFENTVLRGGIAWKATPALTITAKGEWNGSDGDGAPTQNHGQQSRRGFAIAINQEGFHRSRAKFGVLRGELDVGSGEVVSILGWRKYGLKTRNDIDSSPASIFESDTRTAQEQASNETYYTGRHGRIDLTLGTYLFHQSVGYDELRRLAALQYGGGRQKHDVLGLYGNIEYPLTNALRLSAGLRWTREEKAARITYVRPRPACSAVERTCPITGTNPLAPSENNGFADKRDWNSLSPRLALNWQVAPGANAYAGWTRGQRSGGYNLRITQPAAFEQVVAQLGSYAFGAETVDSYEAGLKWQGLDGRATVNLALFQAEVDSLQREINVPSLTSGLAQYVYNTADARIRGFEVEAAVNPVDGLRLSAALGHIDARYTRVVFDINSDGAINRLDRKLDLPRAPKWTWNLGAQYDRGLGEWATLTLRADFQHRSRFAYTDNNWGFNSASDTLDGSLALALEDPAITITLYGRNLLDEVQFGGDTQLPFAGGPFSDGNNRPYDPRPAAGTFSPVAKGRTVGLAVAMAF